MVEHYPGTTPVEGGSGTRGGGQAGQVTEQARQQSQQLAQQARQQASQLANRGNEQLKGQLSNQKHDASQRMVPVQSALRETAQQLRKQGQGSAGDYAEKAADQVERFSTYLRETEVDEIMDEVRGFARRRPGLFLGSAAAIGFFATRFLKSSSSEQQQQQQGVSYGGYARSRGAVSQGTQEPPATALPPVGVEAEPPPTSAPGSTTPTTRRTPRTGQSPIDRERPEPPVGS